MREFINKYPKRYLKLYLKSITPPYKYKDVLVLIASLTVVFAAVIFVYKLNYSSHYRETTQAQVAGVVSPVQLQKIAEIETFRTIVGHENGLDLNNNGKKEFIVEAETGTESGLFKIYEALGDNSYVAVSSISVPGGWPNYCRLSHSDNDVQDTDGDGLKEILTEGILNNINYLRLYESSTPNGFPDRISWEQSIGPSWSYDEAVGDTDSDGKKEILVLSSTYQAPDLLIYENTGNDSYQKIFEYDTSFTGPLSMDIAPDLDGDGKPEILISGNYHEPCADAVATTCPALTRGLTLVLESTGDNTFDLVSKVEVQDASGIPVTTMDTTYIGNLDNDGRGEFVVGGGQTGGLISYVVFEATGDNTYTSIFEASGENTTNFQAIGSNVADFNGDGRNELVLGMGSDIRIFQSTGDNTFEMIWEYPDAVYRQGPQPFLNDWRTIGSGDFDGDNFAELIFEVDNTTGGPGFVYEMQRAMPTSTPTPATPTPAPKTGDITGTIYSSKGPVISGVKITLRVGSANVTYLSDAQGKYVISGLLPGRYQLTYVASGYSQQKTQTQVVAGKTTSVNVTLQPKR